MNKVIYKWISLVLMLVLGFGAGNAQADVYMKQKRKTSGMKMMGYEQAGEELIEEIWITDKGYRSNNAKNAIIMEFGKPYIVSIDHEKKTYMEIPLNMEDMMKEATAEKSKQEAETMKGMMEGMMKFEAEVEVTDDWQKINGWKARKYLLTITTFMGKMTQEIWATEELKIDKDLYDKFSSTMLAVNPALQNGIDDMMKEMKKIKGVQVRNVFTQKIMNQNMSSTTDLLEYKDTKAPSGILDTPAGYKKKKFK